MLRARHSQGLHHTLHQYLSNLNHNHQFRAEQQECCWRLQRWEEVSPDLARDSVSGAVLGGLDCLVRGETGGVREWAEQGRRLLCERLELTSLQTTGTVYPVLAQLRQLSEMVQLAEVSNHSEAALAGAGSGCQAPQGSTPL